ncbi:MAG: hypothetical protein U9M89_02180 [Patescibacteria group bacterium]|nr:hypothetical protein [Patescibacteria group bacterium]
MYFIVFTNNFPTSTTEVTTFLLDRIRSSKDTNTVFFFVGEKASAFSDALHAEMPTLSDGQLFNYEKWSIKDGLDQCMSTIELYWTGKDVCLVCSQEDYTEVKKVFENFQTNFPGYTANKVAL